MADGEGALGPGEVAFIAGGVPHGAVSTGGGEVEMLNALSPRRTEESRSEAIAPGLAAPRPSR